MLPEAAVGHAEPVPGPGHLRLEANRLPKGVDRLGGPALLLEKNGEVVPRHYVARLEAQHLAIRAHRAIAVADEVVEPPQLAPRLRHVGLETHDLPQGGDGLRILGFAGVSDGSLMSGQGTSVRKGRGRGRGAPARRRPEPASWRMTEDQTRPHGSCRARYAGRPLAPMLCITFPGGRVDHPTTA